MLDIRATLPNETTLATLLDYHGLVRDRFPMKQDRLLQTLEFQLMPSLQAKPPAQTLNGYLFCSEDKTRIVQPRLDGFTFNRLRPYDNWKAFRGEARELWEKYQALAKPISISQVGLRYINRIELRLPFNDVRGYFKIFPDIPPKIPQGVSQFFMRTAVSEPSASATAWITLALEPFGPEAKSASFIFDIEAISHIQPQPSDEQLLWTCVETLRDIKNRVFFESITEDTKALFR